MRVYTELFTGSFLTLSLSKSQNIPPIRPVNANPNPYKIEIEKAISELTPNKEKPVIITPSLTPHPAKDMGRAIVNIDNGTTINMPIILKDIPNAEPIKNTLKTEKI